MEISDIAFHEVNLDPTSLRLSSDPEVLVPTKRTSRQAEISPIHAPLASRSPTTYAMICTLSSDPFIETITLVDSADAAVIYHSADLYAYLTRGGYYQSRTARLPR